MKMILLREKFGDEYIGPYETDEEREELAAMVVAARLASRIWYDTDSDKVKANEALASKSAWSFLKNRTGEYEWAEECSLKKLYYT